MKTNGTVKLYPPNLVDSLHDHSTKSESEEYSGVLAFTSLYQRSLPLSKLVLADRDIE